MLGKNKEKEKALVFLLSVGNASIIAS